MPTKTLPLHKIPYLLKSLISDKLRKLIIFSFFPPKKSNYFYLIFQYFSDCSLSSLNKVAHIVINPIHCTVRILSTYPSIRKKFPIKNRARKNTIFFSHYFHVITAVFIYLIFNNSSTAVTMKFLTLSSQ